MRKWTLACVVFPFLVACGGESTSNAGDPGAEAGGPGVGGTGGTDPGATGGTTSGGTASGGTSSGGSGGDGTGGTGTGGTPAVSLKLEAEDASRTSVNVAKLRSGYSGLRHRLHARRV
jgi:hypothetical protein